MQLCRALIRLSRAIIRLEKALIRLCKAIRTFIRLCKALQRVIQVMLGSFDQQPVLDLDAVFQLDCWSWRAGKVVGDL